MNPGLLKHKITFLQHITGINSDGFPNDEWPPFATVWAAKRGLSGREYYAAAAVQSETDVVFTIRYKNGITTDMQIVDTDDHTYNIKSIVDRDGSKRFLEIRATEVPS